MSSRQRPNNAGCSVGLQIKKVCEYKADRGKKLYWDLPFLIRELMSSYGSLKQQKKSKSYSLEMSAAAYENV